MTEKEKMIAGEWFDARDAELTAARARATELMHRLNSVCAGLQDECYRSVLRDLCPDVEGFIRAPFYCDYGFNIFLGEGSFVNFDCVFLDLAPIRIGRRTLVGPKVQLLTAHHPIDAAARATGIEAGLPIRIGDDCWLGGGAIVCPGVMIGDRSIVGAGAVVTRDVPADCIVAGNPARILRRIEPLPVGCSGASGNPDTSGASGTSGTSGAPETSRTSDNHGTSDTPRTSGTSGFSTFPKHPKL